MRGRSSPSAAAVAIAVGIALAASGVGFWAYSNRSDLQSSTPSPVRADGPTLYQALSRVNSSISTAPGGPWQLFSVYGVAAQLPFSANVIDYPGGNRTVNNCGDAFNGVTLWNGTMPVFTGTFNSGTAPFWQFAYLSATGGQVLLSTVVLNSVQTFPPIAFPGACSPWYDFPQDPSYWTQLLRSLPVDSSLAASAAWSSVSPTGFTREGPFTQILQLGPGVFDGLGETGGGYAISFDRCGQVGVAGVQSLVQVTVTDSGQAGSAYNLTEDCALQYSGHGSHDGIYDLIFTPTNQSRSPTTTLLATSLQVAFAYPNGTLTGFYDGWGLANWMTSLNITTAAHQNVPMAPPSCGNWVPSIASCLASATGWFVVLLSPTGGWLGSYGESGDGPGWTVSVGAIVSNESLIAVFPSGWNVTGDVLSVSSTVTSSEVTGSVSL